MAANNDLVVKNNANGKYFYFRSVELLKPKKSQGVIAIPLINTSSTNTILFRFSGSEESVNFTFALFNDDTDVSNSHNIKTVAQQIQYLKDEVFTEEYTTDWDFWDTHDIVYPSTSALTGVLSNLEFDIKRGAATVIIGSCTIKRGRVGFTS